MVEEKLEGKIEGRVDIARLKEISHGVMEMMQRRDFPFDREGRFPDAILPKNITPGSYENSLWSFFASFMDYRTDSHQMYNELRTFCEIKDGNVRRLLSRDRPGLARLLGKHFPRTLGEANGTRVRIIAEAIAKNNALLEEEYNGDPTNIFSEDIDATERRIANFHLFGLHKAALFHKNMVRFRIWNHSPYEIPVKVDRHAAKICLGAQAVKFYQDGELVAAEDLPRVVGKVHSASYKLKIRNAFKDVTREENISAVDLNDGMWAIGYYLCRRNNRLYCDTRCSVTCESRPITDAKGKGTYIFPGTESRTNLTHLFR